MAKVKRFCPSALIVITLIIFVEKASADVYWNNNNGSAPGGDRSWGNANNWIGGSPAVASPASAIVKPWPNLQQMPIVNTLGNTANQVYLTEGSSMSVVEGGSLLVNAYVTGQWNNCGVTTVSDGLLQTGNLLVGSGSFDGDINISGGNIVANFIEIKNAGGAKLDISGGTVSTTTFSIYNPGGGVGMNISGSGSFVAANSQLGNINYWINNKSITANGGASGWEIKVDTSIQAGKVVLTAVRVPIVGNTSWVGSVSSEWVEVNNWSNGLPSEARGDASVLLNTLSPNFNPYISTTGNTIPNDLYIGVGAGLVVGSGGDLTVGRNLFTGQWGSSGVVDVSGGILNIAGTLYLRNANYDGKIKISDGGRVVANDLSINSPGDVGVGLDIWESGSKFVIPIRHLDKILYWVNHKEIIAHGGDTGWMIKVDTVSEPGKVLLTADAASYSLWASNNGVTTGTLGDDFDGDGVSNGVEYVLGGSKDTSDSTKLPQLSISEGNVVFTFVRDQASISGATLEIQVGNDLVNWPTTYAVGADTAGSTHGVTIVKDAPAPGKDTITLSVPQSTLPAKLFARLSVGIK